MLVSEEQLSKTPTPRLVTLSRIFKLVRLEHPEKAESPMDVTLLGIFILLSEVSP
jgi:hypothetical protein